MQEDGESGMIFATKVGPGDSGALWDSAGLWGEKELLQKQEDQILEGFCSSQGVNSTALRSGDGVV